MTMSHDQINILMNWDGEKKISDALNLYGQAAVKALKRTIRKYIMHVRYTLQRTLAMQNAIPQKVMRGRIFTGVKSVGNGLSRGSIWVGLNPVDYSRVGSLRQTKSGVRAGKYDLPGAFLVQGSKRVKVFRRVGKAALPIERLFLHIDEKSKAILHKFAMSNTAALTDKFIQIFEQELNYALRVEKS
jgi:hypothetical protein